MGEGLLVTWSIREVEECPADECMSTCSACTGQLLFLRAGSRSFRMLLESEKLGWIQDKNLY